MNGISLHITVSSLEELKRVLNQLEPIEIEETTPLPTQAYQPAPNQDAPPQPNETQYTFDQLSQAAAMFAKSSPQNRDAAMALLEKYDVKSLADLQQEQYGTFAAELNELGAKI